MHDPTRYKELSIDVRLIMRANASYAQAPVGFEVRHSRRALKKSEREIRLRLRLPIGFFSDDDVPPLEIDVPKSAAITPTLRILEALSGEKDG